MYLEKSQVRSKMRVESDPAAVTGHYDFPRLIENLKKEKSWKKGELASLILLKSPQKKIVLVLMQPATEISSFQENDSITFRAIEGKMNIRTEKGSVVLAKGDTLVLHDRGKYLIISEDEAALLITLESCI